MAAIEVSSTLGADPQPHPTDNTSFNGFLVFAGSTALVSGAAFLLLGRQRTPPSDQPVPVSSPGIDEPRDVRGSACAVAAMNVSAMIRRVSAGSMTSSISTCARR